MLCLLIALGAVAGAALPAGRLDWQPAQALAEPWRAWTAAFVHLSPRHLAANLAGCAVLALLGWRAALAPRAALAWLLAWPVTHLLLLVLPAPALPHYAGLSGVLHAGVAVAGVALLRGPPARGRRIGAALLAGLVLKLLLEAPWRGAVQPVAGWDFPVAPAAHVAGSVAGLACAWLLTRRRSAGP